MRDIPLPFRGASNATAYIKTPGDVAPLSALRNFQTFEPKGDRARGGKRRGVRKVFAQRLGTGPIQGLAVVPRASAVIGQRLGACSAVTGGTSRPVAAPAGQVFGLDAVPSLTLAHYVNVTGSGPFADTGPGTNSVNACCISPDGRWAAVATNYVDASTRLVARFVLIDLSTGQMATGPLAVTRKLTSLVEGRYINAMVMTADRLYVLTNQYVNVYGYTGIQGTTVFGGLTVLSEDSFALEGWANETVQAVVNAAGTHLYIAFNGTGLGATLPSAVVVTPGTNATHFRSGVMKCQIVNAAPYLRKVSYGPQLPTSDPFYEPTGGGASHGYWRLSEQRLSGRPRGGIVSAIAIGREGSADAVYLTHTNSGRGPNSTYAPDGSTGYTTITKIVGDAIAWSSPVNSIISAVNDSGLYNDIPTPPTSPTAFPSLQAVCVDADGVVYVAGRRGPTGVSVLALDPLDGSTLWDYDSGGTILQAAIAIDPASGHLVVAGVKNTAFEGGDGIRTAHLWMLERASGALVKDWTLGGGSVSGLCVAAGPRGILYGTDKV
jgi:hypothetical protein